MEIKYESERVRRAFENVDIGDAFECNTSVYIKIAEEQAFQMKGNFIRDFNISTKVVPLKAVLTIKEK